MSVEVRAAADLQYGGWVGQTSGGTKYALVVNSGGSSLNMYKNIDTTPTLEDSSQSQVAVHGTAAPTIRNVTAAMDSSGNIMVVSFALNQSAPRNIAYRLFSTSTDTWSGSWTLLEQYDQPPPTVSNIGGSLSCLSNDDFDLAYTNFVKFMGTDRAEVFCTTYTGTWSSRVDISTTAEINYKQVQLTVTSSDDAAAFYYSGVGASSGASNERTSGTWGGTETEYGMGLGGITFGITATGSTIYRYHLSGYAGIMRENNVTIEPTSSNIFRGASYLDHATGDRYALNSESTSGGSDLELHVNTGSGWSIVGDLQAGTTEEEVRAGWSFNNLNNTGSIDYLFGVGTAVHWDEYALSADVLAAASVVAASNTPDTVVLTNPGDVLAAASAVAATSTPDTAILGKTIPTAAAPVAVSATSIPILTIPGGGGPIVIEDIVEGGVGVSGSSVDVTAPATVNPDDLLLFGMALDSNGTPPITEDVTTDWIKLDTHNPVGSTLTVWYLVADGSEDGQTWTFNHSSSETAVYQMFRLSNWDHTTAPEISITADGDSAAADPPSLTASWGAEDENLFIAFGSLNALTFTAGPSGYINFVELDSSTLGASGPCSIGAATKSLNQATEDPGAFTNGLEPWAAFTVVVRPGAGGPGEVLAAASVAAISSTSANSILGITIPTSAAPVAASLTTDAAMLSLALETSALVVAGSNTPDTVELANAIMAAASVLVQSNTPDTVPLLQALTTAASIVAASSTPDNVALLKSIIAQVSVIAASNTSAPTLSLEILAAASAIAISNTNDLVVLVNIIQAAASVLASSSTNDAVKLILEHAVSVQVLAASNTSTPILLRDINAAAAVIAASLTPNDGVLGITLPTAASILAISNTSDLVELVTSGIVFASALVQAASNTSTPILALELLGAAAIQAISNTPDTVNLSTAGEILAAALVAANSATSDTSMLALSIPTSASINAASATGIPALIKSIAVSVGIDAASQTPDTVPMLREVSASALAEAASNTSDPTLGILMLVAAAVGAVSVTNDNVTLIVSSAQGVVTATVSVGVPGITGTVGLPTITGSAGVPGISAETP